MNEQLEENRVPANAGTPCPLCRSASRLCLIRLDHLAGAAAITPLVDAADEFVVDVHLLGLDTIWPDYLFMYHYFLNQFVEDVGRQLCNAGIFPDEGQELFDIFVDLIALCNLCCQLLPLPLEGGDILKGCCAPAGACGREQPVNAGCRERFLRCGRRQSRQMPTANHLEKTRR